MRKSFTTLAASLLTLAVASPVLAQTFVTIGTGGQTGVYYVVGQSICKLVNRGKGDVRGIRFEMTAEGVTGLASAHPVRAQGKQAAWYPRSNLFRHCLQ